MTYVLNNSLNDTVVSLAEEWERELLSLLSRIAADSSSSSQAEDSPVEPHPLSTRRQELGIQIAFSTGVSLETEIGSSSNTDVGIVILSYLTMFIYVALTLGGRGNKVSAAEDDQEEESPIVEPGTYPRMNSNSRYSANGRSKLLQVALRRARMLVNTYCVSSKFTLGLFGIIIVLCSVSCAVGIFSAMGVKVTLIIAEVIPFMLLAVGVDNIFLLCNEMDRQTHQPTAVEPGMTRSDPSAASIAPFMVHQDTCLDRRPTRWRPEGIRSWVGASRQALPGVTRSKREQHAAWLVLALPSTSAPQLRSWHSCLERWCQCLP